MTQSTLVSYRCLFIHLIVLGIPYRFGFLPTGYGRTWLIPDSLLDPPCSMFDDGKDCTALEIFCIRDFGMRFILHYELVWIIWFTMRRSQSNTVALHKILLVTSTISLASIIWWQSHFLPAPMAVPFNSRFYKEALVCYTIAIVVSVWSIFISPAPSLPFMKWSIPGNAVFVGGLINAFIAVATFQALWDRDQGIEHYYRSDQSQGRFSPLVQTCFSMAAIHTLVHAFVLFRVRTFLSMPQLRTICFYKLLLNLILPFFWFPELSPHVVMDQRMSFMLRGGLIVTYFLGFAFAGKAEGFSRILSSEKDD